MLLSRLLVIASLLLLVALLPQPSQGAAPKNVTLKIGVLFDFDFPPDLVWAMQMFVGAQMAADAINSDDSLLPDFNITLIKYDQTKLLNSARNTVNAIKEDMILGMVGDVGSTEATPAALIQSSFKVPKCSGTATSPALSDKGIYTHFFRTLPNDNFQGRVLTDYILSMGWKRIGIAFSSDPYGQGLAFAVADRARQIGVTVGLMLNIVGTDAGGDTATEAAYDNVFAQFKAQDLRIIVLATSNILPMLQSLEREEMLDPSHVYLSFEQDYNVANAPEQDRPYFDGLFYTQPTATQGSSYDALMESWEDVYHPLFWPSTPLVAPDSYITFVYDCVFALAYGYQRLLDSNDTFTPEQLVNYELNDHLDYTLFTQDVAFDSVSGHVTFDENGDRIGSFAVRNARLGATNNALASVTVATWDNTFTEVAAPVFFNGSTEVPVDRAPPKPEYYLAYTEGISIALLLLTAIGFLSALAFLGVLIHFREAPAFKSSSVIFCSIIIIGCIIGFASIPLGMGEPSLNKCMGQPWLYCIGFSLIYASLFAKTWRIHRIFDNEKLRVITITNKELGLFTGLTTAIQMLLLVIWTAVDPLQPVRDEVSDPNYTLIVCASNNNTFQLGFAWTLLAYNALIIVAAAFLAFKTRHVSTKFRESKYIGLSVYNVILVCIVIVPLLTIEGATNYQVKALLLGLAVFVLSSFVLYMLFTPKVLAIINNSSGDTSQESDKAGNNMLSFSERERKRSSQATSPTPGTRESMDAAPSLMLQKLNPQELTD